MLEPIQPAGGDMIADESITPYMDRFINRYDIWGNAVSCKEDPEHANVYYQKPTQEWPVYEPVSISLMRRHLGLTITCHWTAIDENGCSKWLGYDGDDDDDRLDRLQNYLVNHGWHVLRVKGRPDRAGHLFLCINRPVSVKLLRVFGNEAAKKAGVTGLELFPSSEIGLSQLRGPLGKNAKLAARGAVDWFVGPPQDVNAQLRWLSKQPINDADDVICVAEQFRPLPRPPLKRSHSTYRGRIDFRQLAQAALMQSGEVAKHWLPGGKGSTHYMALNPRRNDHRAGSFTVNLRTGIWKDFATNDAKGGDLISLVAYLENCSQIEAARKLADFLGGEQV
jgi:hypothetical protein